MNHSSTNVQVYRSPKIEVRKSPLEGRGVFALRRIIKGELVAIKAGHIVSTEQLAGITPIVGDLALQIHDQFYLSPICEDEIERMSVFINHSCDPNVGFSGQISYVAMRDIDTDEELFHDYSMARSDDYLLKCRCGSPLCRGNVTGSDWQNPELQLRYRGYFAEHVAEKIRGGLKE